jgi:hypothetical protein
MYTVDRHDRVVELAEVPRPSVGAPLPVALADEGRLLLAYLLDVPVPGWDGTRARVVEVDTATRWCRSSFRAWLRGSGDRPMTRFAKHWSQPGTFAFMQQIGAILAW